MSDKCKQYKICDFTLPYRQGLETENKKQQGFVYSVCLDKGIKECNKFHTTLEDSFGYFGSGAYRSIIGLCRIPTVIRKTIEGEYTDFLKLPKKEKTKHLAGLVAGGVFDTIIILGAAYNLPESLYILLATNVISGIYEAGKIGKKSLDKIIK